jgi:hypothetical protein
LIDSIGDWLTPLHSGITLLSSRVFTLVSVAWPFSVASFEGKQDSCLVVSSGGTRGASRGQGPPTSDAIVYTVH